MGSHSLYGRIEAGEPRVYIPPFPSAVNPLTRKNFDTPRALNIYLHTRMHVCTSVCLDIYICICVHIYISRNLFFGERADSRNGVQVDVRT